MWKVKVNDIQIHYEVHGEGFPLVMIMGLGGDIHWWDPRMVQELSKRFRLIMFDNRGAGRTDVSDKRYTLRLFADDTAGLMDALGISRAHILGISMGGMIAQELALSYPEKVEKLVLLATACGGVRSIPPSEEVMEVLTAERNKMSPEEILRGFFSLCVTEDFIRKNPDYIELSVQQTVKPPISNEAYMRQLNAAREFDTYDRLPQIGQATLILQGKQDILTPPENGSILAEAIPNAKLVLFENSAHGLIEEMDKVIHVLLGFLTES